MGAVLDARPAQLGAPGRRDGGRAPRRRSGLVLVRTQRKRHKRRAASDNVLELAEHTVRDLAHEAGKLIDEGPAKTTRRG